MSAAQQEGARAPVSFTAFDTPDALAIALAGRVAQALRTRLANGREAALAVSGGRTPTRFLEALAQAPLAWERVYVTLVDERWVDERSDRSNAALVRRHLLKGPAARAHFLPLFQASATPEEGLEAACACAAALPLPFAAVVLGMGADGHTASFFPDADPAALAAAFDPRDGGLLRIIHAPSAGEPRITFTLPPLLEADALFLHIEGADKGALLDAARAPGPEPALPIRTVLHRARRPLDVFWCP